MEGSDDDEFNGFDEEEDFDFDEDASEPMNPSLLADDDADEHLAQQASMKAYKIISFEDIIARQQAKTEKIHEVLGIALSFARILLVHYSWDEQTLLSDFFERGIEFVFKSAGVVAPKEEDEEEHPNEQDDDTDQAGPKAKCRKKEVSCESCMDDVPEDNTTRLNCGHRFCNDCYQTYVAMKINEGQANAITCMAYKCNTKLDETLIPKLVDDPVVLKKYQQTLAESYVNDNPLVKWCTSTPHCGNAAEVLWGKQVEVQCDCSHRFCFNCLKDPHSPVPCSMVNVWLEKCQGEGETFKYISANTKDCPKCHSPVEKNGGCNLMTCRCGTFFCWLCGAQTGQAHTWEKISGHSCGKYLEDKTKSADEARVSLQRYMHYYERYKAHMDSSMLEAQMRVQLIEKVSVLHEKNGTFTSYEEKWLARALDMLFECRRVLKWSYVLAFFIFGPEGKKMVDQKANEAHKMLFEDHQEQLEITTEILSKKLETPPQEMDHDLHLDIMNITVLAERRCKGLYDIILTDIVAKGAYGFDVSGYSFSLELSSFHHIQERLRLPSNTTTSTTSSSSSTSSTTAPEAAADAKEKPLTVGLNSPVAKIERKRDDDARARLMEARRAHRNGADVQQAPEEKQQQGQGAEGAEERAFALQPATRAAEREQLRQAMNLSEDELQRALEASEREFLSGVVWGAQDTRDDEVQVEEDDEDDEEEEEEEEEEEVEEEDREEDQNEEQAEVKKNKGSGEGTSQSKKRKRAAEEHDLEQELMAQAIAASMKDF